MKWRYRPRAVIRDALRNSVIENHSGNVFVTGIGSDNAFKITPGGVITEIIDATGDGGGNPLNLPRGIAADGSGNVFVTGSGSDNAFKITFDEAEPQLVELTFEGILDSDPTGGTLLDGDLSYSGSIIYDPQSPKTFEYTGDTGTVSSEWDVVSFNLHLAGETIEFPVNDSMAAAAITDSVSATSDAMFFVADLNSELAIGTNILTHLSVRVGSFGYSTAFSGSELEDVAGLYVDGPLVNQDVYIKFVMDGTNFKLQDADEHGNNGTFISFADYEPITNVVEVGDLNVIDDPGNPSDGLRFLDMTFSDGLSQAAALANAQAVYPNARLATPQEWDDLFAAANITYSGALTVSDAFAIGATFRISTDNDVGTLLSQLGSTVGDSTLFIWSDPDGSGDTSTSREFLVMGSAFADIRQDSRIPPAGFAGWLIVTETIESFVLKQVLATGQSGFGVPVALDGNAALVGAPGGTGSASLLDILNGGSLQTFHNPNPATAGIGFDEYASGFQTSVALSSGHVFISAARESFEAVEGFGAIDSGAVYMFDADTGALLHTFIHPNPIDELGGPGFGQGFGREIAVNGDYLLVGTNVREAFLFDVVTGDLLLTLSDPIPGFLGFGADVALSDQFIAIGDSTNSGSAGAVHLFDKITGAFHRTFFNPTPSSADFFGEEIALDGNRILVGAGQVDIDGLSNAGEAYLFDAITGVLLHTFVDPTPASNQFHSNAFFGRHLDIEGDVVAISAMGDNEVHIFDAVSGNRVQTITREAIPALFGRSLDLNQGNLLIGDPFGQAFLYGRDQNQTPTSNAGPDQLVFVGSTVILDGTGSTDPESDPLFYSWSINSAPQGSTATLIDEATAAPSFVPDLEGFYEVVLVVSDTFGPGTADSVEIMVISSEQFAVIEIVSGGESIVLLAPEQVTTQGNQNALMNFLMQATIAIQAGDLTEAISKLQKALLRTDGCVLRGIPDGNGSGRDWITDCSEQVAVYASLSSALEALSP